jgi:hypothetical protein
MGLILLLAAAQAGRLPLPSLTDQAYCTLRRPQMALRVRPEDRHVHESTCVNLGYGECLLRQSGSLCDVLSLIAIFASLGKGRKSRPERVLKFMLPLFSAFYAEMAVNYRLS